MYYGSSVKYGVFQDCGGLLFRLHLHIQKLRNMTGVISETTEKIISMMQKNAGEFMVKIVFSVVSDSCFNVTIS